LIDRSRNSSVLDVRNFTGAAGDTDYYLVVAEVRERLAESKQAAQNFDEDRFNLSKLNMLDVRKQYWIEFTKRFAFENIKGNTKASSNEGLGLLEWKEN
jgi:hypothetical protein